VWQARRGVGTTQLFRVKVFVVMMSFPRQAQSEREAAHAPIRSTTARFRLYEVRGLFR